MEDVFSYILKGWVNFIVRDREKGNLNGRIEVYIRVEVEYCGVCWFRWLMFGYKWNVYIRNRKWGWNGKLRLD